MSFSDDGLDSCPSAPQETIIQKVLGCFDAYAVSAGHATASVLPSASALEKNSARMMICSRPWLGCAS